ncbi:hypothetical protein HGM15179_008410 [Zosterops borbonicus]|uniref:Rna-directed dna polymerase from mobile element jockey-like n=1 Tax=Zosterops borbonicus TaxID=364589 RepID=A0A8K1GIL5_9PASS|nr:hypothetical protein HGM15179_008410 [Zosterops borbonicus]
MDSGISCILSKFADNTKLCEVVDMLEGRDVIQRDLGRLERWGCATLMEFNKAKSKALHLGQDNPKHKYRLGREWIESSFKRTKLLVKKKLSMNCQCALADWKDNCGLGCTKTSMASSTSSAPFSRYHTWNALSSPDASNIGRT